MSRYFRRVIRIVAEDSPNVAFALAQRAKGIEPDGRILVPGVLTWQDYCKRLAMWDDIQKAVSLWATFYEGPELKLFPNDWVQRAMTAAVALIGKPRKAKAIGIDTALGGDITALVAVDEFGVIEIKSQKTKDTSVIFGLTLGFMNKWQCAPENVCFDAGGGGANEANRLRASGYPVRTVAFGEAISMQPIRHKRSFTEKVEQKEDRYVYANRRAQMYGEASQLLDPSGLGAHLLPGLRAFAMPAMYCNRELVAGQTSLIFQLSKINKDYDDEGRLKLLPKKKPANAPEGAKKKYLTDLIGHSPDEADAFVLAVHGLLHKKRIITAGGF